MDFRAIPAIEVKGLSKTFNGHLALKDVEFTLNSGDFLTVVGPNGAGKTTLLRILATIARPSSGDIKIMDLEARRDLNKVRRLIGIVPHQTLLYDDLTAYENLTFYGRMYDVPDVDARIYKLTEKMGLESQLSRRVHTLSRGIQQRFSIIRALLHDPSVLLMDEPETGLDQRAMDLLYEIVHEGTRTVVMTSHRFEHGLELANRVIILVAGRIRYHESARGLDTSNLADLYRRYTEDI